MALSNEAAYYEALASPFQRCRISKNAITTVAGRPSSMWLAGGFPAAGAAPTTAAVPTATTTGAWAGVNDALFNGSGTRRILKVVVDTAPTAAAGAMLTICDRLSHQGGLNSTVTTEQTTNLPTAALTRKTGGVGVEAGLEIYTQIGTTATTVKLSSYTNSASTASQVSPLVTFGGTGFREASRIVVMPYAQSDVGVKSVEGVQVTATTGTAGAFGVTLFYPLVSIPLDDILSLKGYADALYGFATWFPQVDADACLFGIVHASGATTGVIQADILISEDR